MIPKPVNWQDNFYGMFWVKFIFVRIFRKSITEEVYLGSGNAEKDFAEAAFTKYNVIEIKSQYRLGLYVQTSAI